MNHFVRILFVTLACTLQSVPHCFAQKDLPADIDTVYNNTGSGILAITADSDNVKTLLNLGMLWGFIKYYHAHVNEGGYNMDAELFRLLPNILAAKSSATANKIMEEWVDHFGVPEPCTDCKRIADTEHVKLMPDYCYLFNDNNFPLSLRNKLEYIRQNRTNNEQHYYIESAQGIGNPIFKHEVSYTNNPYPDAGTRLLALYRYWNMIQYFYPDRHLIGEDWSKVLSESVPEFCNAKNIYEYYVACKRLSAHIHDTHAGVWGSKDVEQILENKFKDRIGYRRAPIAVSFIENKLVVIQPIDTLGVKDKIKAGDVIEKIDGRSVEELIKKNTPLASASNYSTQLMQMASLWGPLLRTNDSLTHLHIRRQNKRLHIVLPTVSLKNYPRTPAIFSDNAGYKILSGNIGYIYPGKLKNNDLDSIKKIMNDTKGIIIDMRCYPTTFMPIIYGYWLKHGISPFVKFTSMNIDIPGMFKTGPVLSNGNNSSDSTWYKGKLIIIVNAKTISQAEYTVMALSSAPQALVIGDTTAGADGNVSDITLPGGIHTLISGIGVFYPDGTETQRVGVKIDKIIKPTIKGVSEGRDELLDAAIAYLNSK